MTITITSAPAVPNSNQTIALLAAVARSNLALGAEQDRTMAVAQRWFDEIGQTLAALTAERAALAAQVQQLRAEMNQNHSVLTEKIAAQSAVIQEQSTTISSLISRVANLENANSWIVPALNRATQCASACRNSIYGAYLTLWPRGCTPTIPTP